MKKVVKSRLRKLAFAYGVTVLFVGFYLAMALIVRVM